MKSTKAPAPAVPPAMPPKAGPREFRSFRAIAALVFQANFSDNALRLVVWLFVGAYAAEIGKQPDDYRSLVAVFYTAPWILFSLFAGQLADKFSKRHILVGTKVAEVVILTVGALLTWVVGWWMLALIFLSLLAFRTTLFGPPTYGMIPEIMPEKRLSWANGWVEGMTFLGAILGTGLGGAIYEWAGGTITEPLLVLAIIGSLGLLVSLSIQKVPAAHPERLVTMFPIGRARENLREICTTKGLLPAVIGIVAWWALAALALQAAMKMAEDTLGMGGLGTSRYFVYVGLGVGIGSWVAGWLSGPRIELGLVPLGGFLMGVAGFFVWIVPQTELWTGLTISLVGFFSGWFIIPLKAYVQWKAAHESRGGVLGTINFFMYLGICVSGGLVYYLMTSIAGLTAAEMFLCLGLAGVVAGAVALWMLPGAALRLMLFVFTHSVYRLRLENKEMVPEQGGALLVCNHLSYLDGLLVAASQDRPVRTIMFQGMYEKPLIYPFAKLSGAIPVSDRMGPRELLRSLHEAGDAIRNGDLVCIFAEGQVSRTGQLLPFRKGLERIMKGVEAPIIPVYMDRVRGTLLAFRPDRQMQKLPPAIPMPITMSFGKPLPGHSSAMEVRNAVQELGAKAWRLRKADAVPLHHEAFRAARRRPLAISMTDARNMKGIRRASFVAGTVAMARVLGKEWRDERPNVAICTPPSIGGAMVNHAALLSGRVPMNLNYSATPEVMRNILEQCECRRVITSREFLEKLKKDVPGEHIYLEDIAERITAVDKAVSMITALFLPVRWIERSLGARKRIDVDDTATLIFTSGSTGMPKGIMLSHWNISSNMQGISEVFALSHSDAILGILPFFHSFGTMATLFLPHATGIRVCYWPSPVDPAGIGAVVEEHKVTFMVTTPTFLQTYTRRVEPRQLGSLEIVLTGAEKLTEQVASAFEERFGIKPFEGYGCTETSPCVTVNVRDFRAPGFYQRGQKSGSIGHPLPGVTIRIVHPETGEELPDGQEGVMHVSGPNIMKGYLNMPEKTEEAIQDGWYVTGDVAMIDEDGFVRITDRLSRFSKMGGEMVPHVKIEKALNEAAGLDERGFVVTSVEDEKKGERLVVLYTVNEEKAREASEKIGRGDLPNLWVPKWRDYYRVEEFPILGSGKLDLKNVRAIAREKAQGEAS